MEEVRTEIRELKKMIGNNANKNILLRLIANDDVPHIIFASGEKGTGKTTLMEWLALQLTCDYHDVEPCLKCPSCRENLHALRTTGQSSHIHKFNMARYNNKDKMEELLTEVFKLQCDPEKPTVFIFEEMQELGENQGKLLEETGRLQGNVYILMTTTNRRKVRDTVWDRALLKFLFKKLNTKEALTLIDNLVEDYNLPELSNSEKLLIANRCENNPRVITNTLYAFRNQGDLSEVLRLYFRVVPMSKYISLFEHLFGSFHSFIHFLNDLEKEVDLGELWSGFSDFIREVIFTFFSDNSQCIFKPEEMERLEECVYQLPENDKKLQELLKISKTYRKDKSEIELAFMIMREIIEGEKANKISTLNAEAVQENNLATKNADKHNNPIKEVPKLNLKTLQSKANTKDVVKFNLNGKPKI